MSSGIEQSAEPLASTDLPPLHDMGPSTASAAETIAALLRVSAGLVDTAQRGADDVNANTSDYASTDADNAGVFSNLGK